MEDASRPFHDADPLAETAGSIAIGVAARVRELREDRAWSKSDLARRLGTSPSQLQKMEDGKLRISLDWMQKLARVFDVKMSALLPPEENDFSTTPEIQELAAIIFDVPPSSRRALLTAAKAVTDAARTMAMGFREEALPGNPQMARQMAQNWARWSDSQRSEVLRLADVVDRLGAR